MNKLHFDTSTAEEARLGGAADPRPLHRRIADDLRAQIAAGEFHPGDPLPSEHALMRRYGVSRGTVRQARASLRADGTIGGSRGRALSVRGAPLTQPLGELVSFTTWANSLGKRPSGRVISFGPDTSAPETTVQLAIPDGATVYRLVRVRLADGQPLMVERTVFPEWIGRHLVGVALESASVYAVLAASGVAVAGARHLIDAITATSVDARWLDVPVGTALLRVRRLAVSPTGEPVEWSDDRYLGDHVNFAIENTALTGGIVRRLADESGERGVSRREAAGGRG